MLRGSSILDPAIPACTCSYSSISRFNVGRCLSLLSRLISPRAPVQNLAKTTINDLQQRGCHVWYAIELSHPWNTDCKYSSPRIRGMLELTCSLQCAGSDALPKRIFPAYRKSDQSPVFAKIQTRVVWANVMLDQSCVGAYAAAELTLVSVLLLCTSGWDSGPIGWTQVVTRAYLWPVCSITLQLYDWCRALLLALYHNQIKMRNIKIEDYYGIDFWTISICYTCLSLSNNDLT